jgi:hypothetical protein
MLEPVSDVCPKAGKPTSSANEKATQRPRLPTPRRDKTRAAIAPKLFRKKLSVMSDPIGGRVSSPISAHAPTAKAAPPASAAHYAEQLKHPQRKSSAMGHVAHSPTILVGKLRLPPSKRPAADKNTE